MISKYVPTKEKVQSPISEELKFYFVFNPTNCKNHKQDNITSA